MERYFDYVITSVEHGKRKPSRSIFEHALHASNGLKETALFVGDSYALDYKGALSAGIPCLLIDPEKHYDVPNFPKTMSQLCLDLMQDRPRGKALDLGCAVGRATFELAREFNEVTGLDFSARFIRIGVELKETACCYCWEQCLWLWS